MDRNDLIRACALAVAPEFNFPAALMDQNVADHVPPAKSMPRSWQIVGESCGWTVDVEITWPEIAKYYRGACANSGEWDGSIRFVFARARWTIDVRLMDLGLERLIERFV